MRMHADARPLNAEIEWLNVDGAIEQMTPADVSGPAPIASVVIPCFNYGRFVLEALESVRAQSIGPVETIVVDDGSTDPHTISVLDGIDWRPGERLLRQANAGLPLARNAGISLARGRYICCLDADDLIDSRYLEVAISALELNPSAGFAYSNVRLFGNETGLWHTQPFDLIEATRNNNVAVSAVFRRSDWDLVGGYSPEMKGGYEDWAFWLSLAAIGRRGAWIREPLFFHRKHGRTMTAEAHERRRELVEKIRRLRPELFADKGALARRVAFGVSREPSLARAITPTVKSWIRKPKAGARALTVVAPYLVYGGADSILLDVAKYAATQSFDVEVLTTLPHVEHPLQADFAQFATKIVHLPDVTSPERRLDHLVERLKCRGEGVILSCGSSLLYENAGALKGAVPSVRWIDIVHADRAGGHFEAAVRASGAIDIHVAGARATFESFARAGVPQARRAFIQNGVDTEIFNADRWDRSAARARFGLPDDGFVVGFVGRMSREKRPIIAARLAALVARHTPIWFFAIGDGPLAGAARRCAPRETVWRSRLPSPEDMAMAYRAMDVLVMPSETEAMPLALLEAASMAVPALATRVGDVPDVVVHGETGFVAPVAQPMALVKPLTELARNPVQAALMGEQALLHSSQNGWTKAKMIESYIQLLNQSEVLDR